MCFLNGLCCYLSLLSFLKHQWCISNQTNCASWLLFESWIERTNFNSFGDKLFLNFLFNSKSWNIIVSLDHTLYSTDAYIWAVTAIECHFISFHFIPLIYLHLNFFFECVSCSLIFHSNAFLPAYGHVCMSTNFTWKEIPWKENIRI